MSFRAIRKISAKVPRRQVPEVEMARRLNDLLPEASWKRKKELYKDYENNGLDTPYGYRGDRRAKKRRKPTPSFSHPIAPIAHEQGFNGSTSSGVSPLAYSSHHQPTMPPPQTSQGMAYANGSAGQHSAPYMQQPAYSISQAGQRTSRHGNDIAQFPGPPPSTPPMHHNFPGVIYAAGHAMQPPHHGDFFQQPSRRPAQNGTIDQHQMMRQDSGYTSGMSPTSTIGGPSPAGPHRGMTAESFSEQPFQPQPPLSSGLARQCIPHPYYAGHNDLGAIAQYPYATRSGLQGLSAVQQSPGWSTHAPQPPPQYNINRVPGGGGFGGSMNGGAMGLVEGSFNYNMNIDPALQGGRMGGGDNGSDNGVHNGNIDPAIQGRDYELTNSPSTNYNTNANVDGTHYPRNMTITEYTRQSLQEHNSQPDKAGEWYSNPSPQLPGSGMAQFNMRGGLALSLGDNPTTPPSTVSNYESDDAQWEDVLYLLNHSPQFPG